MAREASSGTSLLRTPNDFVLTIARWALGTVMFAHGAQKMLGWFGGYGYKATLDYFATQLSIPAPLAIVAICAEFFGGLGLIFGFLTRIAALGILGNMAVAMALIHWRYGLFANWTGAQRGEGFEFHLLAIALALILIVKGGGALSLDHAFGGGARWTPDQAAIDTRYPHPRGA